MYNSLLRRGLWSSVRHDFIFVLGSLHEQSAVSQLKCHETHILGLMSAHMSYKMRVAGL